MSLPVEVELWEVIVFTLVGIVSGTINTLAGGGSLLTVPLMLFFGIPAPIANGTNRIGILFQSLGGVFGFFKKGFSDFKLSLSLAFFASLGAYGGAKIGVQIEGRWFDYLLVAVMALIMIVTIFSKHQNQDNPEGKAKNLVLGHVLMFFVGVWGGAIQIGVGFLLMPVLNRILGLNLIHTNMHKVFIVTCYTCVALFVFINEVEILWIVGLMLAFGNMIGGWIGAYTSVIKGEKWIKTTLYITLVLFMIKLLFFP